MMYLTVIFIPPLYFMVRKRWGAFILNAILYLLAWATVFFFGIGLIFWALAVGHAGWHLRKEMMREHAQMVAKEMVAKMKESKETYSSFTAVKTGGKHYLIGLVSLCKAGLER